MSRQNGRVFLRGVETPSLGISGFRVIGRQNGRVFLRGVETNAPMANATAMTCQNGRVFLRGVETNKYTTDQTIYKQVRTAVFS